MPLTTTGHDANAYLSLEEADAYWSARNSDIWAAAEEAAKEAAIIEATQYIDAYFGQQFVGQISTRAQLREWPRTGAYDASGRILNGIPLAVRNACAEFAMAALASPLEPVEERGGRVKRTMEQVGSIREETEYADHAPSGRSFRFAEMMLKPVLSGKSGLRRA